MEFQGIDHSNHYNVICINIEDLLGEPSANKLAVIVSACGLSLSPLGETWAEKEFHTP